MARKPRVEFPGAFYHVIARANRRAPPFMTTPIMKPISSALNATAGAMTFDAMPMC